MEHLFCCRGAMLLVCFSCCAGCYAPASAPSIEYSQPDSELLREELGKMDWE